jgi:hypothetical protein
MFVVASILGAGRGTARAMETTDLLLSYDCPYDAPFLAVLGWQLGKLGRTLVSVSPQHLDEISSKLRQGDLISRAFLDRAADTDPSFGPLEAWAAEHVPVLLNPPEDRRRVWKKSNLHWEFIRAGVNTPYTLVIPARNREPVIGAPPDLSPLREPFAIKPDLGGGGWGVKLGVRTWDQVEQARREMPNEDLLLQELIEPETIEGRRAWFRAFYACGETIACWWDDRTRVFGATVTAEERQRLALDGLWSVLEVAASIARLQLFSTEVARRADGRWVAVDYVNDPVDLRILGYAREGMPPEAAERIAAAIAAFVARIP